MNIAEKIRMENANRRDGAAVIEGSKQWTYGEVFQKIDVLRDLLAPRGIGPGTRVAFRCEDGIEYIAWSLALLESGAAIVPVSTDLTQTETNETLERIDVHGFLSQAENPGSSPEGEVLTGHGFEEDFLWQAREPRGTAPEECEELNAAFIRFSSGTTGASKGVVLTHQSIIDRTDAANEALGISPEDIILWVLSMSHHFVVSILLFLRKGATIVIGHRDFPTSLLDAATEGDITFIYASPVHYEILAETDAVSAEDLGNVRIAISTAMKLPPAIARSFAEKFGFELAEAYGIIEVGLPFINLNPGRTSRGSVGRMLDAYKLKIDNKDDSGVGEVFVRGQGMFDAYFSPWCPREEALEDGWFRTGDLGKLDEEDNLQIVGRSKTVIVCAGMKVFPVEVEAVLNAHPAVEESLVYGADHPTYGQIPEARIVPADPEADTAELTDQLRKFCYDRLTAYKVPKAFIFVEDLPRTPSGKLVRHQQKGT
ncbi:MAG: class I adenylate-forming enzyme family protein [Candidatus Brocadiia bacterium]